MSTQRLNAAMVVRHVGPYALRPLEVRTSDRSLAAAKHYGFVIGYMAIIAAFALPSTLLLHYGLATDQPGGSVFIKFLPSTYLAIAGGLVAIYGSRKSGGLTRLFQESPALAWATALLVLCAVYSVLSVGISGVAIYANTYLSAMFLAVATAGATPRQRRIIGYTLVTFATFNVAMSVLEGLTMTHFLPLSPDLKASYNNGINEFRGQAFYEHPLTGALATSLAVFLVMGMRLRNWISGLLIGALFIGLMSFGGRAALAVTILIVVLAAMVRLAIALVRRRLSLSFLAAIAAGALLLPVLLVAVVTFTDVGTRIMSHLYMDNSADVRVVQWRVLDLVSFHQALFGTPSADIVAMKTQIGLNKPGTDIESFPLLMFLNLGLVGLPFYALSLLLFVYHLGSRTKSSAGWLMVTAAMLICSTSNSLGRKTPDLMFLSAFAIGLSGFSTKERTVVPETPRRVDEPPVRRTRAALSPNVTRPIRALAER